PVGCIRGGSTKCAGSIASASTPSTARATGATAPGPRPGATPRRPLPRQRPYRRSVRHVWASRGRTKGPCYRIASCPAAAEKQALSAVPQQPDTFLGGQEESALGQ